MNTNNNLPAPSMVSEADSGHAIMETVLMRGDISKLSPAERNSYYMATCTSLGLNPLTRPFEYITLNGKMTLYAKRDCADQLRKLRNISIEIVSRDFADELLTVHVRATDEAGRKDEDYGVVSIGNLRGEARANAILKAITKAKRRVTLSICGLGLLDETEVEDIPAKAKASIGEDGWPRGSIHQEGDYADGTPENATKQPEQKTYPRSQGWMKLQTELDAMVEAGSGPVEITEWASEMEPKTRNWPPEPRRQWQYYVISKLQAVVDGKIEHDGELADETPEYPSRNEPAPPRPYPAEGALSQQAIEAREQAAARPSRFQRANATPKANPTDPDEIAELLST